MPIADREARLAYHRAYNKQRYQEDPGVHRARHAEANRVRRADLRTRMDALKSAPCADCDGTFPPVCMDWDHLGDKEFDIATLVGTGGSWSRILAEVAKCELVCANCHRLRTQHRLQPAREVVDGHTR